MKVKALLKGIVNGQPGLVEGVCSLPMAGGLEL